MHTMLEYVACHVVGFHFLDAQNFLISILVSTCGSFVRRVLNLGGAAELLRSVRTVLRCGIVVLFWVEKRVFHGGALACLPKVPR